MDYVEDAITIHDPVSDRLWTIPRERVTSLMADVSERWVANVIVPETVCRAMIPLPFLEPIATEKGYVLSLCAIFMRHAAPQWAPLVMGPASRNCALRIACRDTRTGQPAIWVNHRYSESILVTALAKLGFPEVRPNLKVDFARDADGQTVLFDTRDGEIQLQLKENAQREPGQAFATTQEFEDYFTAGVRSYGPGREPRTATMVDLHKNSDNHFAPMPQFAGVLTTAQGAWPVDSVYRTVNGLYEWRYEGDVAY
ncbi:hypothetical protein [Cerasicoccus arenae]|nr:hypothetical protein [Cerasicoccus arenae]MBK1858455.1 hypothetical protein [Cerasicoccus arenae]